MYPSALLMGNHFHGRRLIGRELIGQFSRGVGYSRIPDAERLNVLIAILLQEAQKLVSAW